MVLKNAKAKGNRQEHRTIKILYEEQGYFCTRAAASLGIFDIIGVGRPGCIMVQVKSNRWPPGPEMRELTDFAKNHMPDIPDKEYINAGLFKIEIWRWRDRVNKPDIKKWDIKLQDWVMV